MTKEAVVVKRKGVRFVAELPKVPEGTEWKLVNMMGRIVAINPNHPPIILGTEGFNFPDVVRVA